MCVSCASVLDSAGAHAYPTPVHCSSQVGGYVTVYDKLTFTTVRNAGHMVRTHVLLWRTGACAPNPS